MFSVINSGMSTALQELSTISNNISNANSTGFKKSSVSFSEFYNGRNASSVESAMVGLGANVEASRRSNSQGAFVETERSLDAAISGSGYFMTQAADQEEGYSVTRNGAFSLDAEGFLVSQDGEFVLGMSATGEEFVGEDVEVDAGTLERIQVPIEEQDDPLSSISIGDNGNILATFGEGEEVPVATISLTIVSNPDGLKQLGGGKYLQTDSSGTIFLGNPNTSGFGSLKMGFVEGSNVDITTEMTHMIRAQQQFNGAARIMQTNSDMIEKMTR